MRGHEIVHYENKPDKKEIVKLGDVKECSFGIVIATSKDMERVVGVVKRMVQSSMEYREYMDYLKKSKDRDGCAVFNKLTKKNNRNIKVEIHHEPFVITTIIETVIRRQMDEDMDLNYFTIAKEVLELHYKGHVGLINVCRTVHELIHSGKLLIPLQSIHNSGGMIEFVKEYDPYISQEDKDMLFERAKVSRQIAIQGYQDLSILDTKFIYYNDGMTPFLIDEETHDLIGKGIELDNLPTIKA